MSKTTFLQVEELEALKRDIEKLPDEQDGLDLRQYKRAALLSADQFKTHLAAVLKLAR
ncbi:hypothetical protein K3727_09405 [Rhodobacteraceae bacterium M382]|nr:hypothetical protein K3727_09405 [Rhodobacteraceae bacterium M382]